MASGKCAVPATIIRCEIINAAVYAGEGLKASEYVKIADFNGDGKSDFFGSTSVKRALHEHAAETIVLASTEKLGAASQYVIAPLKEATVLVVTEQTPTKILRMFRQAGINVVIAS